MRMNNIPRALPNEQNIAEPIELGSGVKDIRAKHNTEQQWFDDLKNANPDPRHARSDYHDPPSIMPDHRIKTTVTENEIAQGYIDDAIMYHDGAHLKIVDENDIYFIFSQDTNFVVKGTKIKIIDKVIKNILPYNTLSDSNEFITEEKHLLVIEEVEESGEHNGDINEIETEE